MSPGIRLRRMARRAQQRVGLGGYRLRMARHTVLLVPLQPLLLLGCPPSTSQGMDLGQVQWPLPGPLLPVLAGCFPRALQQHLQNPGQHQVQHRVGHHRDDMQRLASLLSATQLDSKVLPCMPQLPGGMTPL